MKDQIDLIRLSRLASRHLTDITVENRRLPGLDIYRRDAVSEIEAYIYEPVICLILQGSKTADIGDHRAVLRPGDALLVSHDLPVISQITEASARAPYLAVIFALDLGVVRGLYDQVAEAIETRAERRPLAVARAEPDWIDPLTRYLELTENPLDASVLGPGIRREIHYRLLLSPIGAMLRDLLLADSHASRIARAIAMVRAEFRATLNVPDLAGIAGMSASSFHQHFKSVTGTTPLQYQKDLRLIAARSLLAARTHGVSAAAYAVGYESPTHFSRDFTRKFGRAPSREPGLV